MNRKALESAYIGLHEAMLDKNSRWYAEDMAHARKVAAKKSDDELRHAISFYKSLDNISDEEINANCQFGGLGI